MDHAEHALAGLRPLARVRAEDLVDPIGQDGRAGNELVRLRVELAGGGDARFAADRGTGGEQVLDADPAVGVDHARLEQGPEGLRGGLDAGRRGIPLVGRLPAEEPHGQPSPAGDAWSAPAAGKGFSK